MSKRRSTVLPNLISETNIINYKQLIGIRVSTNVAVHGWRSAFVFRIGARKAVISWLSLCIGLLRVSRISAHENNISRVRTRNTRRPCRRREKIIPGAGEKRSPLHLRGA
ncbi:hypothetical protein DA2_3924 [Desulfovibrio sp. A2]|nr:hypothetical protein DA2_3924 [Desulfovibrio sp. A2]